MAETTITSDLLGSNPAIDVSGTRFSAADGVNINRQVAYLQRFLPFFKEDGQSVEVRGHDTASTGPAAAFYDEAAAGTPDVTAEVPYLMVTPGPGLPSQSISFKHIAAAIQLRDSSRVLLSSEHDYVKIQKRALRHTLWSFWNQQAILGNSGGGGAGPQFDGLQRLVTRGLGQLVTPTAADQLDQLDEAMEAIRVRNRKVDLIVMNYAGVRKLQQLLRNKGLHPVLRFYPQVGKEVLTYNGIPVCENDFVPNSSPAPETSVYFVATGRSGVYVIRPRKTKRIFFKSVRLEKAPFVSLQAHMYTAIVSTTSDALVRIPNWDVSL